MTCNASGSGMGTSGLVGQFMTFQSMSEAGVDTKIIIIEMLIMHFIAPAVICFVISELMRKMNFIESGDMKLDL